MKTIINKSLSREKLNDLNKVFVAFAGIPAIHPADTSWWYTKEIPEEEEDLLREIANLQDYITGLHDVIESALENKDASSIKRSIEWGIELPYDIENAINAARVLVDDLDRAKNITERVLGELNDMFENVNPLAEQLKQIEEVV
jgi:hypothetical protein